MIIYFIFLCSLCHHFEMEKVFMEIQTNVDDDCLCIFYICRYFAWTLNSGVVKFANISEKLSTGHSHYVDFAYLDTTTYVEVIFHSQNFFSIFLCISTPSMSKTVNMKQRVSRGDFSCPRRIFYNICYCLCRSIKSALAWAPYCLLRLCTCISWGANIFQTTIKINQSDQPSFDWAINP